MPVTITLGPIARSRNNVIGRGGELPWRLKSDLIRFKQLTLGKPVDQGPADLGLRCR